MSACPAATVAFSHAVSDVGAQRDVAFCCAQDVTNIYVIATLSRGMLTVHTPEK
jgi:hypothetical protein